MSFLVLNKLCFQNLFLPSPVLSSASVNLGPLQTLHVDLRAQLTLPQQPHDLKQNPNFLLF